MTHPIIHAQDMVTGYGHKGRLGDLTFELDPGLTHGLIGANGVGKTTLLRAIAGQLKSTGLTVFGHAPFDNPAVMDRTVLMGIDNPLIDGWNVTKLFRAGAARWPSWNHARAEELVERFELPRKNYSALSRGQKSAMGIIFAVASGCELMLLDEPYLGLDVAKRQVFYDVLQEEHGRNIVVSTHHLNEVSGFIDTVLLLGDTVVAGPIDDFVENIIALTGPADSLDRALSRLQVRVIAREDTPVGHRAILDLRRTPALADVTFDTATSLGLRAGEVSLEQAVLALQGVQR